MRAGWTSGDVFRIAERGFSLHQQGRHREAAVIFDGLIAVDPQNVYCRDALAAAWLAMGEPQRAIEQLNMILRRDGGNLTARSRRLEAHLLVGDFTSAKADYDVLNRLLPAHESRRVALRFETAVRQATLPGGSR